MTQAFDPRLAAGTRDVMRSESTQADVWKRAKRRMGMSTDVCGQMQSHQTNLNTLK